MHKGRSWIVRLAPGIVLLLAIAAVATFRASQHVPEFYSEVLELDAEYLVEASQELESRVTMLYSDAARDGDWYAQFTEDQINSWLAVDWFKLSRGMVGDTVHDPRVNISPGSVTLAARIDEGAFSVVYWITVEIYLAEPNTLAFRIRQAHAGKLPLPISRVIEKLTAAARHSHVPLRWTHAEGDPVGIVSIAPRRDSGGRELRVEKLELLDGELLLAGVTLRRSDPADSGDAASASPDVALSLDPLYIEDHIKVQR